ncbi:MAG TPA: hypothetical protein VFB03_03720 [Candidatus Saccharimonadales bacterium]|nr:hypothetical protein [Candidatus Saccharimonadales bacterium]
MSIRSNKITNTWQNSQSSLTDHPYFLAHEQEPVDNWKSFAPDDIKQELFENRFFLKRRVWRNMRKIRRHPQVQYRFSGSELTALKLRHIG